VKKTKMNNNFNRNSEINNDTPSNVNNNKYNSSLKYKEQDNKNDYVKKEENFNIDRVNSRNNNLESQGNEYENNDNNSRKGKIYEYENKIRENNNEYEPKAVYEEKKASGNSGKYNFSSRFERVEEKDEFSNKRNNNNNNNYLSNENKYSNNHYESFRRNKVIIK